MEPTRFSVVITCYNQKALIQEAVNSGLSQRHPGMEIIVVDDGSTDGSLETLAQYCDAVQLIRSPVNGGAIDARNRGASRARGDYLVFLDGDDVLMRGALELYERIIVARNPVIILAQTAWFTGTVPTAAQWTGEPGITFVEYENLMAKDRPVGWSASSFVVKRQSFWDVGGWSHGIFYLDCIDLATKLAYSGSMILICAPATVWYRLHAGNSIHTVPPFVRAVHQLIGKERSEAYSGGRARRFERYAWFGGMVAFWIKRTLKAGLYKDAMGLAVSGWSMILAGIVRRAMAWVRGRRPVETLG